MHHKQVFLKKKHKIKHVPPNSSTTEFYQKKVKKKKAHTSIIVRKLGCTSILRWWVLGVELSDERGAFDQHRQALQLRQGQAQSSDVVAAQKLNNEALLAGEQEPKGEQHSGPHPVAQIPQQPGDQAHH